MEHRNELGKYYQKHYKTGVGVEVGVQYGYFSQAILENWKGKLFCVDIWPDHSVYAQAVANLGEERLIRKPSTEAALDFKDESLDFVFIDAGHRYDEVKADIEAWFPKVRKGGIISGHDYVEYSDFGVIQAVDEFCAKHGYKIELTDHDMWEGYNFKSWYFTK